MPREFFYVMSAQATGGLIMYTSGIFVPGPGQTRQSAFRQIMAATIRDLGWPQSITITNFTLEPNWLGA